MRDIIVVLADSRQLHLLKTLGKNIVCVDSTFGITKYNLKLTTIIVINEFGCGVPVAHFVTQQLKKQTWVFCLRKLREALGEKIITNVFMTDDDCTYYKAWSQIMGKPNNKLLLKGITGKSKKKMFSLLMMVKKSTDENTYHNNYEILRIQCLKQKFT